MRALPLVLGILALTVQAPGASPRALMRIDTAWHFHLGDIPGAERPENSGDGWTRVDIPHNWGWEDAQQGRKEYRGPGCRRPAEHA